jgi:hypothetical protein
VRSDHRLATEQKVPGEGRDSETSFGNQSVWFKGEGYDARVVSGNSDGVWVNVDSHHEQRDRGGGVNATPSKVSIHSHSVFCW